MELTKNPMRTAFINALVDLAKNDPKIFLLVGDLGYSVVEPFAQAFPDRFLNMGVAEQNMTGVAAGLASEGYHVFTYSIANFPTFRCAEQIRNDVAYHGQPVTVVAVGGGLAYGSLGYSHHAVQDMALLRLFPGLLIAAPGDPYETKAVMEYLVANPQPSYLRLGKAGEPLVQPHPPSVEPGKLSFIRGDIRNRRLVLTTGATLKLATDAFDKGPRQDWALASVPLWGEGTKAAVAAQLREASEVITVEDHLVAGGFGSYIQEALNASDIRTVRLRSIAISPEVCAMVASQSELNRRGGLSIESICAAIDASQSSSR